LKKIEDSIKRVKERIARACSRAGRSELSVRLIGVTKGVDIERIRDAASCGIGDFGENYVQEAKRKIEGFEQSVCWHMIGYVQTNKVKYIQKLFNYVHSVDRWELLEGLDRYEKDITGSYTYVVGLRGFEVAEVLLSLGVLS